MTQEALNIAGQCRATASSPLAKNISVDDGNGLLTELLLDAARVIEALAQTEQEPVAYYHPHKSFYFAKPTSVTAPITVDVEPLALYTYPPQREWVGLTDEEFHDLQIENIDDPWANFKAIEAKLKEKNT